MTSNTNQASIDLSPLLTALQQPLQLVSDPETRERLQVYANAAHPQIERAAFDILSAVVDLFNDADGFQRASLKYANGGLHLRIEEAQDSQADVSFNDSDLERVTLRLPIELKRLIDTSAARHGISANSWYIRALSRAVARRSRGEGPADMTSPDSNEPAQEARPEGRRGRRRGSYRGRGSRRRGLPGGDAI